MNAPLPFRWDGEAMSPLPRTAKQCDDLFVVGEVYLLDMHEERSGISHRHFFASVKEAWVNLPDVAAERFPTPDHLRKFALIRAGFADSATFAASSKPEALRLAAFMRPIDEYAVITTAGATVTRWTAQSQSMKHMGKERFQASKQSVLDVLATMLDVRADDLVKAVEAA